MGQTEKLLALLGCDIPFIQAPMAGVQDSGLALAACRAGALGSLPAAILDTARLRQEIEKLRMQTDKPFNVNFFAHTPPTVTEVQKKAWFEALLPFYRELGLDEKDVLNGNGRQPFGLEQVEMVEEYRLPIVSFHFGLPAPELLGRVKRSGAVVMSSATTMEEARWLEANGADVVIAQGLEAGGHRGMFLSSDLTRQMGTFSLLPQICRAVSVPVVAAGGIADAQTVAAARALGAAAVQVGTALMLADEAQTSAMHRAALQSSRAGHTVLTNLFSGGYARGIVNRFIEEAGPIHPAALPFPLAANVSLPLKTAAEALGLDSFSSLWAGQNALLAESGCAEAIIGRLMAGWGY